MLSFKDYLALYEDDSSTGDPKVREKLKHLEHVEDLIVGHGAAGAQRALSFMKRLIDTAGGAKSGTLLASVKIDGAPSIVAGPIPAGEKGAGEFFVGTKSALSPNGKRYTRRNADQIDAENTPGLAAKLKAALRWLPELRMPAIFQGDFLFTSDDVQQANVDGQQYLIFKPNVVTYAVQRNSETGKEVSQAKVGIVFHTVYEGDTFVKMHATFNPDLSQLAHTPNVWWKSVRLEPSKAMQHSKEEVGTAQQQLAQAERAYKQIDHSLFNAMAQDPKLAEFIKQHLNSKVRQGRLVDDISQHVDELHTFIRAKLDNEAQKLKTSAGQQRTAVRRDAYLSTLHNVRVELIKLFQFFNHITAVKLAVLKKWSNVGGLEAFYHQDGKYRRTTGEGLVLADAETNDAVKLVDRLDFSHINFTQPKDWKK